MSGFKKLAFAYLFSASAFTLTWANLAHPVIGQVVADVAHRFDRTVWQPALAYAWREDVLVLEAPRAQSNARVSLELAPPGVVETRLTAHYALPPIVRPGVVDAPTTGPQFAAPAPDIIAPDLPVQEGPVQQAEVEKPRRPLSALTAEQDRAYARLADNLTPEMRANFDLFLYVSKASSGPLAQRMYVFRRQGRELALVYDWAASTGREKPEMSARGRHAATDTPRGYYELDPGRMFARYRSYSWDQDMPYAMFFNWQRQGLQTGLAIHAATGDDIARLGTRASAGCVHLAPDNARTLFNLIRENYRGPMPRLAYDARSDSTSNDGRFAHDAAGRVRMVDGYRALIFIEDYGGGDEVAALF